MNKPSDYELRLLRALWRAGRMSAREVHEASHEATGWSFSATRKTLDRMLEKGLIRLELMHGLKTYVAAQTRLETLAGLMTAFARDVLDMDAPLPVAAFAQSKLIAPEEVDELERLLARLSAPEGEA